MSNLLSIDIGNTNPHVGIWTNNQLDKVLSWKEFDKSLLKDSRIVVSQVGKLPPELKNLSYISPNKLRADNQLLGMPIQYAETLGEDRLALAYHAWKNESQENPNARIMVLDAGTFTTVDIVSEYGHEGGLIFPGPQTFLDSYGKGELLPRLDLNLLKSSNSNLGHDTNLAILEAAKIYLKSMCHELGERFSPTKILLTGGQALYLSKSLEASFSRSIIHYDSHLIHKALFEIYKEKTHS